MKTLRKILLIGSLSMFFAILFAQNFTTSPLKVLDNFLDSLQKKSQAYNGKLPEERVYLQFDKTMYQAGETIWFAIYLRDAQTFNPSKQSDILNIEFINPKGSVEKSYKVLVKNGVAEGNIDLDENVVGGLYKVRAYTTWQKNDENPLYFEKEIQVQKLILPRLKMKLEFLRKAYGAGDKVRAKLDLQTNANQALANQKFKYVISIAGKKLAENQSISQESGSQIVEFDLPKDLKSSDGLLNIMIDYEGQTESISRSIPIVLNKITLQLFPEGGNLVDGLPSKIAFRAANEFGKPADIEGLVVDENEKVITKFSSFHDGMGAFSFTPNQSKKYTLKITNPVGVTDTYSLPDIEKEGYVLNVDTVDTKAIKLSIGATKKSKIGLVTQIRGKIVHTTTLNLKSGTNNVSIPTLNFPAGVAQITIFDENNTPFAERLVFVNAHKQLNIKLETDKTKYLPREKVRMKILTTDSEGKPVSSQLSLAVVDDQLLSFADDKSSNLLSFMYLESDIKEKVEEPSFYFNHKEAKAPKALDYLLMTAGWRRFTWEKVLESTPQIVNQAEKACFAGRVLDFYEKPIANAKVTITPQNQTVRTDKDGYFSLNGVDLEQPVTLTVTGNPKKHQSYSETFYYYSPNLHITLYDIPKKVQRARNAKKGVNKEMIEEDREIEKGNAMPMDVIAVVNEDGAGRNEAIKKVIREEKVVNLPEKMKVKEKEKREQVFFNADVKERMDKRDIDGDDEPTIAPIKFVRAKKFAAPIYKDTKADIRSDFRSTIYWNPAIVTNKEGKAQVEFYNSDAISSFCATTEGIGNQQLGRSEYRYFTQLPFALSTKIPIEVVGEDLFSIPVTLKNTTSNEITGNLVVNSPSNALIQNEIEKSISLAPQSTKVIYLNYKALSKDTTENLKISFVSSGLQDAISQTIKFVPKGFPVELSASGNQIDKEYEFNIKNVVRGSLSVSFKAYPTVANNLMASIAGMLREPYGCFEQTSSTSYPNLLVLKYLQEQTEVDAQLVSRAETLLDKGYKRLISYETKEKGYEWFGGIPAHEALTAYGLMQFNEMKSVSQNVDLQMIDRTATWLLSRRNGRGGYSRSSQALDSYGRASEEITNIYITFALTEAGYSNLENELERVYAVSLPSKDAYQLALAANALLNAKDKRANEILKQLLDLQQVDGSWNGKTTSITCSTGQSLQVETTSLALRALLKSENPNTNAINKGIQYLLSQRSGYGDFGSTQATILALKTIIDYTRFSKKTDEAGTIEIYIDNQKVATKTYEKGSRQIIDIQGFEKYLTEGKHKVRVKYVGVQNALPYSVGVSYYTSLPETSPQCKVKLTTQLSQKEAKVGETIRLSGTLQNLTNEGLPMTMAIIGIPAGLSVQAWQLKEMQEKKVFDFYEIFGNRLAIYYRQMLPSEKREINLDLKAEIVGEYFSPASCGYLYYTKEFRCWTNAGEIVIKN